MTTILILLSASASIMAAPVEVFRSGSDYVLYQEATKTYTIGYVCTTDGKEREIEYASPTNFEVEVKSSLRELGEGTVEYAYSVKNLAGSRQGIQRVWVPSPTEGESVGGESSWRFVQASGTDQGFALGWQHACKEMTSCLQPGEKQGRLQFTTASLPIIGRARLVAWDPLLKFCGEGPNADVSYYLDRQVFSEGASFVPVRTAVPGIALGSADVSNVMEALGDYIDQSTEGEMDGSVSDELVAHIRNASSLARDGQRELASSQLKDARQALDIASSGRSGKGVAKDLVEVLRFDLDYLLGALKR